MLEQQRQRPLSGLEQDVAWEKYLWREAGFEKIVTDLTPYHKRYMENSAEEIVQEVREKSSQFFDLTGRTFPFYECIEGTCGSGKTTMHREFVEKMRMSTDDHNMYTPKEWNGQKFGAYAKKNKLIEQAKDLAQPTICFDSPQEISSGQAEIRFNQKKESNKREIERLLKEASDMGAQVAYKTECLIILHSLDMAIAKARFYEDIAKKQRIPEVKKKKFILARVGVVRNTRRIFTPIVYELCQKAEGKPHQAQKLAQRYLTDFVDSGIVGGPIRFFEISTEGTTLIRITKRAFPYLEAKDTENVKDSIAKCIDHVQSVSMYKSSDQRIHKQVDTDIRERYSKYSTTMLNSTAKPPQRLAAKTLSLAFQEDFRQATINGDVEDTGVIDFIRDVATNKYSTDFINPESRIVSSFGDVPVIDLLRGHSNDYGFNFEEFEKEILQLNSDSLKKPENDEIRLKTMEVIMGKQLPRRSIGGGLDVVIPYQNTSKKFPFEHVLDSLFKSWLTIGSYLTDSERKMFTSTGLTIRIVDDRSSPDGMPDEAINKFREKWRGYFNNHSVPWSIDIVRVAANSGSVDLARRKGIELAGHEHLLTLDSDVLLNPDTLIRMFQIEAKNRLTNGDQSHAIISTTVTKMSREDYETGKEMPCNDWLLSMDSKKAKQFAYSPDEIIPNGEHARNLNILKETNYLRDFGKTDDGRFVNGKFYGEWTKEQLARPGICFMLTKWAREVGDETFGVDGAFENAYSNTFTSILHPEAKFFIDPKPNVHINDPLENGKNADEKSDAKNKALQENGEWFHKTFLPGKLYY